MNKKNEFIVKSVESKFNYKFQDEKLIIVALTHSSMERVNSKGKVISNERLEFLGDAILDFIISEYLFTYHSDWDEGVLTKIRSVIVREESLAQCGKRLQLGLDLLMSNSEDNNGGRKRDALIADAMEAIFAAIFLDSDYQTVKEIVINTLKDQIKQAVSGDLSYDYKSELQELVQAHGENSIEYLLVKESGPDHDKLFEFEVTINGESKGKGKGKTKKTAQQNAAEMAFKSLRGEYAKK